MKQTTEFDRVMNEYMETLKTESLASYHGTIETPTQHASKVCTKAADTLKHFYKNYKQGFAAISDSLKVQGLERPVLKKEPRDKNKRLYQQMGFSEEDLATFYKGALYYIQKKDFERGRDAFYFLTTLSNRNPSFWLGLAICNAHLNELKLALEASLNSLELDPKNKIGFLYTLRFYRQLHEFDKAIEFCNKSIEFVKKHNQEPWAQELFNILEAAKESFKTHR